MPNLYLSDDGCAGCAYEDEDEMHPKCSDCIEKYHSGNKGAHWTPSEATIAICKKIIAMGEGEVSNV